jgi:7-cyano-7-deazaguanine synthase
MKKAVVLLSGGLDSATTLFWALKEGYRCDCLTFDYGQRHRREIETAKKLIKAAKSLKARPGRVGKSHIVKIVLPWKGSSLLDKKLKVPSGRSFKEIGKKIPSTYVPARNTIFLSHAASVAEAKGIDTIFIGAHTQDSSGYPDCRAEFFRSFEKALNEGTRQGGEREFSIKTPLITMAKADIIRLGASLGVPFTLTRSCYHGGRRPCGRCDSCRLRRKGFREAGLKDPALDKA